MEILVQISLWKKSIRRKLIMEKDYRLVVSSLLRAQHTHVTDPWDLHLLLLLY